MNNDVFQKARYRLTAYYVGILFIIIFIFSSILIATIESKIRTGLNEKIIVSEAQDDPFKKVSDEIEFIIFLVDGALLIIFGSLSYFLAGKTLLPIRENSELQKKFFTDASHDLRTPLAIITTESEVTLQDVKAGEVDYKKTIISNLEEAKKMSILVNDLLMLSRVGSLTQTSNHTRVDLSNLVETLVMSMKTQALVKGISLKMNESVPLFVMIDVNTMKRAISNILQNAINYTERGGITVDVKEDTSHAIITITDSGVGIDTTELPFVFDRFYKASHSRNDQGGSGLGLPIAKEIIESNKGHIAITSTIKKGTTVTITLPKKS